jgi:predicted short-subunit dehydrogenase-like oxidoreductase (DUF2520 family)
MFDSVTVIGAGRVGSAMTARLRERGLRLEAPGRGGGEAAQSETGREGAVHPHSPGHHGELRLLCVPDSAIAEVAREIEPGPWIAHVSGATTLSALEPHERRFSVHPLQTFTRARGAEQLDGAWAAITAETDEARERALWLAKTLGLEPFALADGSRPLYHAAAAIASNYLVTLYRTAAELFEQVGAPPEALVPLMRRTIENGFELTGPIARGDWATVDAHRAAIHAARAELDTLYETLAGATLALAT